MIRQAHHERLKLMALSLGLASLLAACLGQPVSVPDPVAYPTPVDCADLKSRYRLEAYAGMPCQFDFSRYRSTDSRLLDLDKNGVNPVKYNGKKYFVASQSDIDRVKTSLRAGDQLILKDGTWTDQSIYLANMQGTLDHPILVRPQTPGGVVLTGTSNAYFDGANAIVWDLSFKGGHPDKDSFVVFALGGTIRSCNGCIASHITIDDYNDPNSANWSTKKTFYFLANGQDITIAHSTFSNKKHIGTLLAAGAEDLAPGIAQRLHVIDNFFSHRPFVDKQNEYEIVRIGWSGNCTRSAYSVIENNRFEYADGENEIITLKLSDIIVRNNVFFASMGNLSLRATNRVLVEGNTFDSGGKDGTGGVEIMGAGHWLVGNRFLNLRKPANYYYWPVSVEYAGNEDLVDGIEGFARSKDLVIAKNQFLNCANGIAMGIYKSATYPLAPKNLYILENQFSFAPKSAFAPITYPNPGAEGIVEHGNSQ